MDTKAKEQRVSRHLRAAEDALRWSREHIDVGLYGTALVYIGQAFVELRVARRYVEVEEQECKQGVSEEKEGPATGAPQFRGGVGASDEDEKGVVVGARGACGGVPTDDRVLDYGCDTTTRPEDSD